MTLAGCGLVAMFEGPSMGRMAPLACGSVARRARVRGGRGGSAVRVSETCGCKLVVMHGACGWFSGLPYTLGRGRGM